MDLLEDFLWTFEGLICYGVISIIAGIILISSDALQIRYFGLFFLIIGVILTIVGGLGCHFRAKRKLRRERPLHSSPLILNTELEKKIFYFLKDNVKKAYTIDAITNQIFSDSPAEESKEMVEKTLENFVKHRKIWRIQKDAEAFYFYE